MAPAVLSGVFARFSKTFPRRDIHRVFCVSLHISKEIPQLPVNASDLADDWCLNEDYSINTVSVIISYACYEIRICSISAAIM